MRHSTLIIFSILLIAISGCNRDKTPPTIAISEPAYDGKDIQYGDLFFVEFAATDDLEDGGLWRVEMRGADGITPKTAQAGLWEGASTGDLVVAFSLDATSWPTGAMTLAVVADDAAGNRAAMFRDLNYTAAEDLPEIMVALTDAGDGTCTIERTDANGGTFEDWNALPASHQMAYSDLVLALADASDATIHLVNFESGALENTWTDATSSGTEPLVRAVHALDVQDGFIVAHAGGVVAIDPTGNLLFERFSEAPWTPIDVAFDGTTCVLWEENSATGNHRLRSWNFQTGATGPIVALANAPQGWAIVGEQDGGTPGNVCMLHAADGLTLVETSTGALADLCPLLGSGSIDGAPLASNGINGSEALYVRGGVLCRQSMAPVTSGSQWPLEGDILRVNGTGSGGVEFLQTGTSGVEFWRWDAAGTVPEQVAGGLGVNTVDVLIVNE